MKTTTHPTLDITVTFDPTPHTYTDDQGARYISVTTLAGAAFPGFDADAAAARVGARDNIPPADLIAAWRAKGDAAAEYGTRVHAYAEALILGEPAPAPTDHRDRRAFRIVDKALAAINHTHDLYPPEQIVFEPIHQIAGTIDLPARNRETGALAIMDWKTCEAIPTAAYNRTALPPIAHVPDSKTMHYALQLSLYAWMLTAPGYTQYPTEGEPVELALIHVPHSGVDPIWRPVPYLQREAQAVVDARWEGRREWAA